MIDEARGKALITVARHASTAGEARVSYRTLSGGSYGGVTAEQGQLVWADGDAIGKTVSLQIDPATLSAGQSGTFQVEFFDPVNATLQNAAGNTVTVLPVTVTVNDNAAPPSTPQPPPAPPSNSGGGGGGGALSLFWLALLGGFVAVRWALLVARAAR